MCTNLKDFILKAGYDSGVCIFNIGNWTSKEAKNQYKFIKYDDWEWILNKYWVHSLPPKLQIEWNNLSESEKNKFENIAVLTAKKTTQKLILNLANAQ